MYGVGVRPAVAPAVPACAARHTPTLNALVRRSVHTATPDATSRSCLCRVCCELDACSNATPRIYNTLTRSNSYFKFSLSSTVLCCRKCNSHRRSGRDTDKTVLSCLAWRCELALIISEQLRPSSSDCVLISRFVPSAIRDCIVHR